MSDWYYAANNEQKGPINESELKANFAGNKLPADTLVWKAGMGNWAPANQVPAFTFRPAPTPAKRQQHGSAVPVYTSGATKVVSAVNDLGNSNESTPAFGGAVFCPTCKCLVAPTRHVGAFLGVAGAGLVITSMMGMPWLLGLAAKGLKDQLRKRCPQCGNCL